MVEPEVMPTSVVKIETPDGTAFVSVSEDGAGHPIRIDVTIGKAGTVLAAWASALSRLMTAELRRGATIYNLVYELAGISGPNGLPRLANRPTVKSAPDGIAKALIIYTMRG